MSVPCVTRSLYRSHQRCLVTSPENQSRPTRSLTRHIRRSVKCELCFMNGYKLRTVSFYLRNHFAADSPSIANEEKNKRCSQGTVSLLSMTSPPAVPAPAQSLNAAADISPHMLAAQPPDEPTAMDVTTVPPSPPPYEAVVMNARRDVLCCLMRKRGAYQRQWLNRMSCSLYVSRHKDNRGHRDPL